MLMSEVLFAMLNPEGSDTRWWRCGLCPCRSWVQPEALFYRDVIILPSQSIPSQNRLQGITSLLSLLVADEDFSMDMLTSDTFVSMYKCTTMNCTVGRLCTALLYPV